MGVIIDSITQAERDWHKSRRMFVFRDGGLSVAALGDERGHREWFADEGWSDAYEHNVRGFFDETGVYVYVGGDYRCDDMVRFAVMHEYDLLHDYVGTGVPIYGGMTPGPMGQRWEPVELLGRT